METVRFNKNLGDYDIEIEAKPGVYAFHSKSGSGKTLMYTNFRKYAAIIKNVIAYSYIDKCAGIDLHDMVNNKGLPDILILDRYDMMQGDYIDIIDNVSKSGLVLVDTKFGIQELRKMGKIVNYIPMIYRDGKLEVIEHDVYIRRRTRV